MSFSLISFRVVIDDACERCHLPFVDAERNFACLAGCVPIWNSFLENGHFLSQLLAYRTYTGELLFHEVSLVSRFATHLRFIL